LDTSELLQETSYMSILRNDLLGYAVMTKKGHDPEIQ